MELVIVPLDGSARAPVIRDAAVAYAKKNDAKLLFVQVVPKLQDVAVTLMAPPLTGLQATLEEDAKNALIALTKDVPPAHLGGAMVLEGTAWRVVCDLAAKQKANLILLGAASHSALEGLLGSVSSKVVNHAPCNVLLIRTPAE